MRYKQPPFLPPEISDQKKRCEQCEQINRPNLWKHHDEPFGPVYPAGSTGEDGMWQREYVNVQCRCGATIEFSIDPKKLGPEVTFYGDEAERIEKDWIVETYSLVAGTTGTISAITEKLYEAKKALIPDTDPTSWSVHTKNMFPPHERARHPMFSHIASDRIQMFFEECAAALRTYDKENWNTAIFGFRRPATSKKQRRRDKKDALSVMHLAILSASIYRATKQGLRPKFVLDAQKSVTTLPHVEGWSRDTFLGSRHYLASEFLTHGNEIQPPEFARPGSLPGLEMADILSYFLARNLLHMKQGRSTEIPISAFGSMYFMVMIDAGNVDYFVDNTIPTKYIPKTAQKG